MNSKAMLILLSKLFLAGAAGTLAFGQDALPPERPVNDGKTHVPIASAGASQAHSDPQQRQFRVWTDITGKFKTEAALVGFHDGTVRLRKEDGSFVSLPIKKLSQADQDCVRQQMPDGDIHDAAERGNLSRREVPLPKGHQTKLWSPNNNTV